MSSNFSFVHSEFSYTYGPVGMERLTVLTNSYGGGCGDGRDMILHF